MAATVSTHSLPNGSIQHSMNQLQSQQMSQHMSQTQPAQHTLAGPSRRGRGRPPGSTNERVVSMSSDPVTPAKDSAAGAASSTRTKNGCWSCRVRRKVRSSCQLRSDTLANYIRLIRNAMRGRLTARASATTVPASRSNAWVGVQSDQTG